MKGKLEQGQSYPFIISDLIELPTDQKYYKLIDPNGVKHLLEAVPYLNYNFEFGKTIDCRIDKINCTGKIFIEPEHPYYTLNGIYKFPFLRYGKNRVDSHPGSINAYFLDAMGNEVEIPSNEILSELKQGDLYEFQVIRIKKGKVYISSLNDRDTYKELKIGKEYLFTVDRIQNYAEKYTYYILKGPSGDEFKLRTKFYVNYGINIGKTISCRLLADKDELYLEPKHPQYEPGKTYEFEIDREDKIKDYPDDELEVFVLRNNFGKELYIPKNKVSGIWLRGNRVRCKVMDIRKSRLYLDCMNG